MFRKPLVLVFGILLFSLPAKGENSLVGFDTNGTVSEIDPKTGTLSEIAEEVLSNYSLGGIARKQNLLYYIASPSGTTEQSIYTVNINTGAISHVDIDRSAGDDMVRSLFSKGKKLFAVFYNGSSGDLGVYQISPTTGATTLILDLSSLSVDPIGGSVVALGKFYYMLVKSNSDSQRQLIKFKLKANSATAVDIVSTAGSPILCDRIKPNILKQTFVCLASPSSTQVDVCKLTPKGIATCLSTLSGVERLAGGHTMVTPDGKNYYAFVYAPGDTNSQRLIKFNAKGVVKSTVTVSTLIIGARFNLEDSLDDISKAVN